LSNSPSNMMVVSTAVTDDGPVCACFGLVDNLAAERCSVMHTNVPGHAVVNPCRLGGMTRQLIELTCVPGVAAACYELPADWIARSASAQVPDAVTTVVPTCARRR